MAVDFARVHPAAAGAPAAVQAVLVPAAPRQAAPAAPAAAAAPQPAPAAPADPAALLVLDRTYSTLERDAAIAKFESVTVRFEPLTRNRLFVPNPLGCGSRLCQSSPVCVLLSRLSLIWCGTFSLSLCVCVSVCPSVRLCVYVGLSVYVCVYVCECVCVCF